jgi:hypothetical protein
MGKYFNGCTRDRQSGATLVLVAICLFVLIAIAALALDIGHLLVTRNELQNAADAGALAGARVLYLNDGSAVNPGANQIAIDAAVANNADNIPVDSVEALKGHWSFATRTFTANDEYYNPPVLWGVTDEQLDSDPNFINAVQVRTFRSESPVAAWFSRLFGYTGFNQEAVAVAYIGFAGQIEPLGVDMPIAICAEALGNPYNCNVGRFINSGGNLATSESGGWTDFGQPCAGAANTPTINNAVNTGCSGGGANQTFIRLGEGITMNNGQVQASFTNMRNCWVNATNQQQPWRLTLPVIECGDPIRINTCSEVVGAVVVEVVWITETGQGQVTAPYIMDDWAAADGDTQDERWADFVDHFQLLNLNGDPAPLSMKTIYFKPDCRPHTPVGISGGRNFGILARIPVLVH